MPRTPDRGLFASGLSRIKIHRRNPRKPLGERTFRLSKIKNIQGRQILDSRGNPTVEVDLLLNNV